MGHLIGRTVVGILLAVTLSACSLLSQGPSQKIVTRAIALQLGQTQQSLSHQLAPRAKTIPSVEVDHVAVRQRQPIQVNTQTLYQVTGTCDIQLTFPNRRVSETATPFEVYLQPGVAKATWLLARPETTGVDATVWQTYPVDNS